MKKIFEVYINGKFSQHLMRKETGLISQLFKTGDTITLKCIEVTAERFKILFGIN